MSGAEWVFALIESCGCMLELLLSASLSGEATTFVKSKTNRAARREAKEKGEPKPPPDRWLMGFIIMTVLTVLLTILLIFKYTQRPV